MAFELISNDKIDSKEVEKGLEKEILGFLGTMELAKSSFKLINFKKNKGIIKVNRKYLSKLKAALTLTNSINNKKIMIKSLATSGILKKAKSRL